MNQKFYVDQFLQKNIHLKTIFCSNIKITLFVSSVVKKNEGKLLKNFGLSNYKYKTVSFI